MKLEGASVLMEEKRFFDNGDGTITDKETNLMWNQTDAYQDTSKWSNWFMAEDYIKSLNNKKYAGFSDWRMPSTLEAKSLYDKKKSNKDYWGQEVPVDKIFNSGFGFLCWTSEVRNKVQAIRFGYRRGVTTFDDAYRTSRGASRLVRDILKEDNL